MEESKKKGFVEGFNLRTRTLTEIIFCSLVLLLILVWGGLMDESRYAVNFMERNLPPSWLHPFGTDWMSFK